MRRWPTLREFLAAVRTAPGEGGAPTEGETPTGESPLDAWVRGETPDLPDPNGPRYPPASCDLCRDTGVWIGTVIRPDGSRVAWKNEPCPANCEAGRREKARREQALADSLLGMANVPEIYADATMDSVIQPPDLLATVRILMANRQSIILRGSVGGGKSYLAAALLREQVDAGRPASFCIVPDLLDRIRRCYGGDGPSADAVLDAVEMIDLLVLDDLGVEKVTEWVLEKLYQIVNSRYIHRRQTVITTNLTTKEMVDRLTYRIASRLGAMGRTVVVENVDRRVRPESEWLKGG